MDRDRLAHRQSCSRRRRALPRRSDRLEGRLSVHGGPDAGWDRGDAIFAPEPPSDMEPHKPHAGFVEMIWAPIQNLLKRLGLDGGRDPAARRGLPHAGLHIKRNGHPALQATRASRTPPSRPVTKVFGFWIALGGTFMAGCADPAHRHDVEPPHRHRRRLQHRISRSRSWQAHGGDGGKAFWTFALAVGVEGFAYAFASIVLITYMSSLASVQHAASQFGLMTSLLRLSGQHSGWVLGLRDRTYRLRLRSSSGPPAHRHPGRAAGGLCMVPRRNIG